MAQNHSNIGFIGSNGAADENAYLMMLEPTPLSNQVDQRHLMHQQQRQQQHEQQQGLRLLQQQLRLQEQQKLQLQKLRDHKHHCVKDELSVDDLGKSRMPNPKRRRGHTVRVRFNPQGYFHSSPNFVEDIIDSWYTREELAVFKKERRTIVKALRHVKNDLSKIDQSRICLRGFEAYMSIGFNKLMQQKREQVMSNVLSEQESQKVRGIRLGDAAAEERLRQVSRSATEWARERAYELGVDDAKEMGFTVANPSMEEWGQDSMSSSIPSLCSSVISEASPPTSSLRKSLDKGQPSHGSSDALARHFQFMKQLSQKSAGNGTLPGASYVSPTPTTEFWSPTSPHASLVAHAGFPPLMATAKNAR